MVRRQNPVLKQKSEKLKQRKLLLSFSEAEG